MHPAFDYAFDVMRIRLRAHMLRKFLRILLTAPLALILLFEEWGWGPLAALMARLAKLPLWARLERTIASLPPRVALATFLLPMVALFPIKLGALYLFASGHKLFGAFILIAAKLAGTAVVARLFHITQPALMQLAWFAKWYPRWKAWKDALLERVRASPAWRAGKWFKLQLQRRLHSAAQRWRRWF
jgi:hypothetical protein